ncbi:MAG: hypothetical protein R3346_03315 [Candidatus Spechtbacterales bacterium]|nr:hypothetical protein [Candidatus Spechtbacterales bacterium]
MIFLKKLFRKFSSKSKSGKARNKAVLEKTNLNPVVAPIPAHEWESWQTFNPAAVYLDDRVHLLYRALGEDGQSSLGYASSIDGINFDIRLDYPIFKLNHTPEQLEKYEDAPRNSSGGGWGGCEDPRTTFIDNRVYLSFVAFQGWDNCRIAISSISREDFLNKNWNWKKPKTISQPGVIDKSPAIFPEKIRGKYVIMHRVFPDILVDYVDSLDFKEGEYLKGEYKISPTKKGWDSRKVGAGAPPIKTDKGWLLIYYATDDADASKYNAGAMLLDLEHPEKVIARTKEPMLEPNDWYENQGHKAGIVYPCGAIVKDGELFIYYGAADTVVAVAKAPLDDVVNAVLDSKKPNFVKKLINGLRSKI